MTWTLTLQAIETLAVVTGVVFALFQLNQLRVQREVQGGAELLRSLQSPRIARISMLLYNLTDNLSEEELKKELGDDFDTVAGLMAMYESMGPLVARGHIPMDIYADFHSGSTVLCWRRLRRYIEDQRAEGWGNLMEWFQWLAERMEERTLGEKAVPAHEQFRRWRKPSDLIKLRNIG